MTRTRPLKVGLYLPVFDQSWSAAAIPRWSDILATVKLAEDVGFDSVWVPDHISVHHDDDPTAGVWEGWSLLAALAIATTHVEIGPLVLCANFRNPAMIAKTADTVDEISGGRLTLGLGAGWYEPEFAAYGFPYDHRVDRFEEALQIVCPLLRDGRVDFAGRYHRAQNCELHPRGPRPQGPPILIGAAGERTLRLAARYADTWNRDFDKVNTDVEPFSAEDLGRWQARVDAACAAVGRDPATLQRSAAVFVDLPGAIGREGWGALAGSPEELAEGLRSYARVGFSHVQLWLEPGTVAGIEAFAPTLELLDRG